MGFFILGSDLVVECWALHWCISTCWMHSSHDPFTKLCSDCECVFCNICGFMQCMCMWRRQSLARNIHHAVYCISCSFW